MNATITSSQLRSPYKYGSSIVYVDCTITTLIDKEFFVKHKIYNLEFKCNTWNAVKKFATNYTTRALQSLFPNDTIKFSAKAGCSCGCSPGYRVTHSNPILTGRDIWVDVNYDDSILNEVRVELARFENKLEKEIFEHKEKVIQM